MIIIMVYITTKDEFWWLILEEIVVTVFWCLYSPLFLQCTLYMHLVRINSIFNQYIQLDYTVI